MATKTKSKRKKSSSNSSGNGNGSSTKSSSKNKELRASQRRLARAQNQHSSNAVPERRPIASQELPDSRQSETFRRLRDGGKLQDEPMDQAAYDRAESKDQSKKAAKEERVPTITVGARVQVTDEDHEYHGSFGAVVRVKHAGPEAERIKAAGTPESNFAEVESIQVRTRGGRHALLTLEPDQVREVTRAEFGRGEA